MPLVSVRHAVGRRGPGGRGQLSPRGGTGGSAVPGIRHRAGHCRYVSAWQHRLTAGVGRARGLPPCGMITVTLFVMVIPSRDNSPRLPRSLTELPNRAAWGQCETSAAAAIGANSPTLTAQGPDFPCPAGCRGWCGCLPRRAAAAGSGRWSRLPAGGETAGRPGVPAPVLDPPDDLPHRALGDGSLAGRAGTVPCGSPRPAGRVRGAGGAGPPAARPAGRAGSEKRGPPGRN
jgi:hypothetical protein